MTLLRGTCNVRNRPSGGPPLVIRQATENNTKVRIEPYAVRNPSARPPARVSQQYRSHSPTPAATQGTSTTPPSRLQAPPRPKSAAARHPDSTTVPPPAPPLPATSTGGDSRGAGVPEVERVKNAPPGCAAGGGEPATAAAPPGDATAGRTEFRGADHEGGGGSSARRSHRRPRPRSAVARVETVSHHGKARAVCSALHKRSIVVGL